MIVEKGGYILAASECRDGFPDHGNFKKLLFEHESPKAFLKKIKDPGFLVHDQWEVQLLAIIAQKARLGLFSRMDPGEVRKAYVEPVADIAATITEELERAGKDAPIAVLPEGPQTIPYLNEAPA
jgi:nickel-dependent lactate racemase